MKRRFYVAATVAALFMAGTASAQFLGKEENPVTSPRMPDQYWTAKPTELTPYVAPNKPHWKLSEVLALHHGQVKGRAVLIP